MEFRSILEDGARDMARSVESTFIESVIADVGEDSMRAVSEAAGAILGQAAESLGKSAREVFELSGRAASTAGAEAGGLLGQVNQSIRDLDEASARGLISSGSEMAYSRHMLRDMEDLESDLGSLQDGTMGYDDFRERWTGKTRVVVRGDAVSLEPYEIPEKPKFRPDPEIARNPSSLFDGTNVVGDVTEEDLARVKSLVRKGMEEGAYGGRSLMKSLAKILSGGSMAAGLLTMYCSLTSRVGPPCCFAGPNCQSQGTCEKGLGTTPSFPFVHTAGRCSNTGKACDDSSECENRRGGKCTFPPAPSLKACDADRDCATSFVPLKGLLFSVRDGARTAGETVVLVTSGSRGAPSDYYRGTGHYADVPGKPFRDALGLSRGSRVALGADPKTATIVVVGDIFQATEDPWRLPAGFTIQQSWRGPANLTGEPGFLTDASFCLRAPEGKCCLAGQPCDRHVRVCAGTSKTCTVDANCGTTCSLGTCRGGSGRSCVDDSDCGSAPRCSNRLCPGSLASCGQFCGSDADCLSGAPCLPNGTCGCAVTEGVCDFRCTDDDGTPCRSPEGSRDDSVCPGHVACVEDTSPWPTPAIAGSSPGLCSVGGYCKLSSGELTPTPCNGDVDCDVGTCAFFGCSTDADCAVGKGTCHNNGVATEKDCAKMRELTGAGSYTWDCPPCGSRACSGCTTRAEADAVGCVWKEQEPCPDAGAAGTSRCGFAVQPAGVSSGCVCTVSGGTISDSGCAMPRLSSWTAGSAANNPYEGACQVWGDAVVSSSYCDELAATMGASSSSFDGDTCSLMDFYDCSARPTRVHEVLSAKASSTSSPAGGVCLSTVNDSSPRACGLGDSDPGCDANDTCVSLLDPTCTGKDCYNMCDPRFFFPHCDPKSKRCLNGANLGKTCDPSRPAAEQCPSDPNDDMAFNSCCDAEVEMDVGGVVLSTPGSAYHLHPSAKASCASLGISSQMEGHRAPAGQKSCPNALACGATDDGRPLTRTWRIIYTVGVAVVLALIITIPTIVIVRAVRRAARRRTLLSSGGCQKVMCKAGARDRASLDAFLNGGQGAYTKRMFDELWACARDNQWCSQ